MLILGFDQNYLLPMPQLEGDEEVILDPQETITGRVKLIPWKRKKEGTRLKLLIPNKLLIKRPILLAQTKAGNNSL